MLSKSTPNRRRLLYTLAFSSLISLGLFAGRVMATGSYNYWFMAWNLLLAWLPLGFGWWLIRHLQDNAWLEWGSILLALLWLGFLPNTFYIASDIIHLQVNDSISLLYDIVMLLSFTFNGFVLGYLSLFSVHRRVRKGVGARLSNLFVATVLLLCSFAIYLGRYLRWNSWDVLINPAGIIFDISEPFINPRSHPQAFTTTLMFFVLIGSIYAVIYNLAKIAKDSHGDL